MNPEPKGPVTKAEIREAAREAGKQFRRARWASEQLLKLLRKHHPEKEAEQ